MCVLSGTIDSHALDGSNHSKASKSVDKLYRQLETPPLSAGQGSGCALDDLTHQCPSAMIEMRSIVSEASAQLLSCSMGLQNCSASVLAEQGNHIELRK